MFLRKRKKRRLAVITAANIVSEHDVDGMTSRVGTRGNMEVFSVVLEKDMITAGKYHVLFHELTHVLDRKFKFRTRNSEALAEVVAISLTEEIPPELVIDLIDVEIWDYYGENDKLSPEAVVKEAYEILKRFWKLYRSLAIVFDRHVDGLKMEKKVISVLIDYDMNATEVEVIDL